MQAELTSFDRQISSEIHPFVAAHARRLSFSLNAGDPGLVQSLEAAGMAAWRSADEHIYMSSDVRMLVAQRVRASMLDFLRGNQYMPVLNERSDS